MDRLKNLEVALIGNKVSLLASGLTAISLEASIFYL